MSVRAGLPGLEGHTIVRVGEALVAYGGRTGDRSINSNVFTLINGTWKELRCGGYTPIGRTYHTANTYGGRMLVFGGMTAVGFVDVHFNTYNVFVSSTLLEGPDRAQFGESRLRKDLPQVTQSPNEPYCFHTLDLINSPSWETPKTTGDLPFPRSSHSSEIHNGCLLVYGGYSVHTNGRLTDDNQKSLYNVYSLNIDSLIWSRIECVETIPPLLWGHASVMIDDILITIGGVDAINNKEERYICGWNQVECQWRWMLHNDERAIGDRALHSVVNYNGRAVVFGGSSDYSCTLYNLVNVFDLEKGNWVRPLCTGEAPTPRRGHTAIVVGDEMIVTGGIDEEGFRSNRSHSLNLITWHWSTLTTTFSDIPAACVEDESKVRQKLKAIHAKRRREKQRLQELYPTVTRDIVVRIDPPETLNDYDWEQNLKLKNETEPPDDPTQPTDPTTEPENTKPSLQREPRKCLITEVNSELLPLESNMNIKMIEGSAVQNNEDGYKLLQQHGSNVYSDKGITITIEQDEAEAPPSPPSSEEEDEIEDAPHTQSVLVKPLPVSNPLLYSQTPSIPQLSKLAANTATAHNTDQIMSPFKDGGNHIQKYGYNVFTASQVKSGMVNVPDRQPLQVGSSLGRYGFVDMAAPVPHIEFPREEIPLASDVIHVTAPIDHQRAVSPVRRTPGAASPESAYWKRQQNWVTEKKRTTIDGTSLPPPSAPVTDAARAWNIFPTNENVKSTTNANRTRYLSPSVVRLGLVNQLSMNQPKALQGPFNGSRAAAHPYGRSLARDPFSLSDPSEGDYQIEGPKNFVTTTNTAIPAGLGPISAAAFLTGMQSGQSGGYGSNDFVSSADTPEVILSRMPADVRNAAALAYKDEWRNWTWEERLKAVQRYIEVQVRQNPIPPTGYVNNDDNLPVLPPAREGAEGWINEPRHAAPVVTELPPRHNTAY